MDEASNISRAFDRAAAQYDIHAQFQRDVLEQTVALALRVLPAKVDLLDAGCGTGYLAAYLNNERIAWKVTGVDIAPAMCEAAEHRGMKVIHADMRMVPCDDNSFGAIFSSLSLQWLEDSLPFWREAYRLLKPGGRIVVTTLGPATLNELRAAFAAIDDTPHIMPFRSVADELSAARAAGLRMIEAEDRKEITWHPDASDLMEQLRGLGASNRHPQRARGLAAPSHIKRMGQNYTGLFATPRGLPATWELITLCAEKPEEA